MNIFLAWGVWPGSEAASAELFLQQYFPAIREFAGEEIGFWRPKPVGSCQIL